MKSNNDGQIVKAINTLKYLNKHCDFDTKRNEGTITFHHKKNSKAKADLSLIVQVEAKNISDKDLDTVKKIFRA